MRVTVANKYKGGSGEYIGRGSPLGNPFVMGKHDDRDQVCKQYADWLDTQINTNNPKVIDELNRLLAIARERPLQLVCFCAPLRCHGDTIKALILEKEPTP